MSRWTHADLPDLTGQVAVVTGANSGLGLQTALQLAAHGAHVVMACRDQGRGDEAVRRVAEELPAASVALGRVDLADLSSVRDFAGRVAEQHDGGINLLVNNAGVMATPRRRTVDGFELQLGTNHLGHFALTGRLLPLLLRRPGSRVVTVTSGMHRWGRIDLADLMRERRYEKWSVYCQSKLANLMFTHELQRRADAAGKDLTSVAAHPGYAATNLQVVGPRMSGSALGQALSRLSNVLLAQSDAMGALPLLYAAAAPDVRGGELFGPDRLGETRGHPARVAPARAALDQVTAQRLWAESERLTGVTYDPLLPVA